ncbi:hypothetical protein Metme_4300 [Methylomonas methanica MC09]|uniref:Uncharacterized protein n=1 Tax=Methylomonas methanica (strain DSM 25384 / MC09) TaxID=857087 RepID=G0A2Z1_METMM|nr:hypothetical protein Metme_4300 [Methylomonas methanica MC09]
MRFNDAFKPGGLNALVGAVLCQKLCRGTLSWDAR